MTTTPDAASPPDPAPAMQRARGTVRAAFKRRGEATVIDRLYQGGSARLRLPRTTGAEAVLLNTAGGVTGGDRFETTITAAPRTALTVTTQTAERLYRSTGAEGRIDNALILGQGARVDWLPQETILFEGARLRRTLRVDMAGDATLLAVEPLVLGRTAMGERVTRGALHDAWRVRRGGALVYADALRFGGDIAGMLGAQATLDGCIACVALLYVAPDASDRLEALRGTLDKNCAASAWNGLLAARILSDTGAGLRKALERAVATLRTGPLPRVWSI